MPLADAHTLYVVYFQRFPTMKYFLLYKDPR